MLASPKALWDNSLLLIKDSVTEQQYNTWFKPIVFESYKPSTKTLLVQVPSPFVYEYLEQNFVDLLSKVLHRRLDKESYKLGIITDICQVGGFPKYKKVKPYVDTDGDGMPDEWEIANGLNPNDPSDANKDCTGDGYTNIEKYINGISTKEKVDWTDMKNNHDTLAEKEKLL